MALKYLEFNIFLTMFTDEKTAVNDLKINKITFYIKIFEFGMYKCFRFW